MIKIAILTVSSLEGPQQWTPIHCNKSEQKSSDYTVLHDQECTVTCNSKVETIITPRLCMHSTNVGRAQLGNSLVHVRIQVVHKFEYCLCATWKLLGKWTQFPKRVSKVVILGVYSLCTFAHILATSCTLLCALLRLVHLCTLFAHSISTTEYC